MKFPGFVKALRREKFFKNGSFGGANRGNFTGWPFQTALRIGIDK
jgi:hypothetical protein